jgi:hypothetical protein
VSGKADSPWPETTATAGYSILQEGALELSVPPRHLTGNLPEFCVDARKPSSQGLRTQPPS